MTSKLLQKFKSALLLLALITLGNLGFAQTTVQIGSGTGTASYFPIYYFYDYNYTQSIYLASELSTGGANASGYISKIRWKPTASVSTSLWKDWVVYLGNTTQNGFTGTANYIPVASLIQVFSGTIPANTTANTWMEITLTTPFLWDGSSNLVVAIDENTASYGNNPTWAGYTSSTVGSSGSRGLYFYQDGTNISPASPTASNMNTTSSIAQIQLEWTAAAACTAPPTPGAATVSNATPCSGQNINLGLSGNSVGSGQLYQWQSSASSAGPWTDISAPAGFSSYGVATTSTIYYRAKVKCGNDSAYSTPVLVTVPALFPGGTYTIDPQGSGATNFTSMAAAVSAISCGITSNIIFNLAPGVTFNEQITLPATIGANASKTVTFNGNGDTLSWNGSASAPWTLGLDGADYITFNNLVVKGTNSTYALVAHLWNQADANTFNNCVFLAPANGTSTTQVPFSISGSAATATTAGPSGDGNLVSGCTMFSGYYNTVFYGNSAAANTGNKLLNCNLIDFYSYGSYNLYQNGITISGNIVERPTRTSLSTFYGIYFSTGCTNALVTENKIRNMFGASLNSANSAYGIYCTVAATAGNENRFYNNLISNFNGNGTAAGLYLSSASHVKVFYNTISVDNGNATTGTVYGIYATGTAGVNLKNNNISITQGGSGTKYCLYFSGAGKTSNYNNLHMGSLTGTNYVGYYSTGFASLALWKGANSSAWDQNSVSENPMFADPANGDFTPNNGSLDNMGNPIAGITTDITGAARSATTPDIGAIEFSVPVCSGSPTVGTASGPTAACAGVPFTLSLSGFTVGVGISIEWQESPAGANMWTTIPNATSASYTATSGITSDMEYQAIITCVNGGSQDFSNIISVMLNSPLACYCTPIYTTACSSGDDIDDVILAGDVAPGINNLNTPCSTNGYANYTSMSATLSAGMTYSGNVTTNYSSASEDVRIWIDYNLDGIFQASEEIATMNDLSNASTGAFSFTVPASTPNGSYRMRIRLVYAASGGAAAIDPCNSQTYGEAHDYTINIAPPPTCMPVTGLTTGTTLFNSVNMSWHQSTSNPANGYLWRVFPQGAGPNGTPLASGMEPAGDTLATATGLSANTNYTFYVKAVCSATDSSAWAGVNFVTPCATFVAPFTETFNATTTPACWTVINAAGGGTWKFSSTLNNSYGISTASDHTGNGGNFAWVDGSSPIVTGSITRLISPMIDISTLATPRLRYSLISYVLATYVSSGFNKMVVDAWDANLSSWVQLDSVQQNFSTEAWQQRLASLSAVTSTTTQIRFTFTGTATTTFYNDLLIDDIYVENTPTCPTPTAVVVANGTSNSVGVDWTENGAATNWQIQYGPTGFQPGTGIIVPNITTKPYTLSGLTAGAFYDVYVRSVCAANDTSAWSIAQLAATLPPNDACVLAIDLSNGSPVSGYTNVATQSMAACDGTPVANDVWYAFTTTAAGSVTVTATSPVADLVLQVFSGSCSGTLTALTPTAASATLQPCIDGPAAGTEYGTFTVAANTTYLVRVYGYNGSQGTFTIQATGAPLAIRLGNFDVVNEGSKNRIRWNTLTEEKGDYFELERSADGRSFDHLATMAANGTASSYTFYDQHPVNGWNYYRLKMADGSGKSQYSGTKQVFVKVAARFAVEAYPNPVGDQLTVKAYGAGGMAKIILTDATGKLIKAMNMENGQAVIDMKGVAPGMYFVKYTDNDHAEVIKVNKQ